MALQTRKPIFFLLVVFFLLLPGLYAARVVSVTLCEDVAKPEFAPINITNRFTADAPSIHAIVVVEDVKPGTKIRGVWISVDAIATPNYEIDSAEKVAEQSEVTMHLAISRPNKGWPAGNYKLNVYVEGRLAAVTTFSVVGERRQQAAPQAGAPPRSEPPAAPRREQEMRPLPQQESVQGSGFSGRYVMESGGTTLTLVLNQDARGNITGTLSSSTGATFQLEGKVEEDTALGACRSAQGAVFFEAALEGNQLRLALIEPDANNMPDYTRARELLFNRQGGSGRPTPGLLPPQGRGMGAAPGLRSEAGPESSGEEVGDPGWGFAFRLPAGWKVKKEPSGALLGHDTVPGFILVMPHMARAMEEVQQQMTEGLAEEGTQLSAVGRLQPVARGVLAADYQGFYQGQRVKARGFGTLSPHGGGAYILAASTPEKYSGELAAAAETLARSMRFFQPEVSELAQHFAGTWTTHTTNTTTSFTLLPNGEFIENYESSYSGPSRGGVTDWGVAGQQGDRGRWTVRGTREQGTIVLRYANGKEDTVEYRVHVEGGQTFWDQYWFSGTFYFKKRD